MIRLCGVSFRANQFVNMKAGAMYKRRIPWVSRLKHNEGKYPNEIHASQPGRAKRGRPEWLEDDLWA